MLLAKHFWVGVWKWMAPNYWTYLVCGRLSSWHTYLLVTMEGATSDEEERKSNINALPRWMPTEWVCFKVEWGACTLVFQKTCRYPFWATVQPLPGSHVSSSYRGNHQGQTWTTHEPSSPVSLVSVLALGKFNVFWAHIDSLHSATWCHSLAIFQLFLPRKNMWWSPKFLLLQRYQAVRQLKISKIFCNWPGTSNFIFSCIWFYYWNL